MTDATRGMVRSVLASVECGSLAYQEALEQLVMLGVAPKVAGILLRQAWRQVQAAA